MIHDTEADQRAHDRPPLDGLVVLDLSRVLSGPYAAMILGDLGARVIKVERPGIGDETRGWGPPFVGSGPDRTSTYFLSVNRNKESIALDFADDQDRVVLEGMIRQADVLIENFRTGVLDRLGLSHARLHELNPSLVVVSITGFGPDGPLAGKAAYDQIVQGYAGLMSLTGPVGVPSKVGLPIADLSAGMFAVIGALAALGAREQTGRGQVVHTSLLAGVVALHTFQGTRWLIGGDLPTATGNEHPTLAPYGAYRCADDRLVQIAVGNESLWCRLAETLDIDAADPRFSSNEDRRRHEDSLNEILENRFAERPAEQWVKELDDVGVPCGLIRTLDDVYDDPQVRSQGLVAEVDHPELGRLWVPGSPIRMSGYAPNAHQAPPRLDQHGSSLRRWASQTETDPVPTSDY